jgi:hypothetical protein
MRDIELRKIADLDRESMYNWILDQVYTLAHDYGQNITTEEVKHITSRLIWFLTEKKRNACLGEIHSIFQQGISGMFGKTISKVTYANLVQWITASDRQKIGSNMSSGYDPSNMPEDDPRYDRIMQEHKPFIYWCMKHDIDVSQLDDIDISRMQDRDYVQSLRITQLRREFFEKGEAGMEHLIPALPKLRSFGNITQYVRT